VTALLALSCALLAFQRPAAAADFVGDCGIELGAGYANAALTSAASPSAPNGGAVRARISYGITDAFGVAAAAQISWLESRRPIVATEYEDDTGALVSGFAFGGEIARTRLQELGLGVVYALDILRVVPFVSAGVSSLRTVEEVDSAKTVDYDAVLWLEVGADLSLTEHILIGASAVFDLFLSDRTAFSGQTVLLVRAGFTFDLGKVGGR